MCLNSDKSIIAFGNSEGRVVMFDLNDNSLSKMVKTLLDSCDIERIRISSIQPQEFTDELLFLWKDKRMCPHFHIPLQSGSNKIDKYHYTTKIVNLNFWEMHNKENHENTQN